MKLYQYSIILISILLSGIGTLQAQVCELPECESGVLNVSTGFNHNSDMLYNPGQGDAFWQLLSVPSSAGNITVPRPVFVIPAYDASWAVTPNSQWISGQPTASWPVNGGPYRMQRCFCVCEDNTYNFNMEVFADNRVELGLYTDTGALVEDIGEVEGHQISTPDNEFNFDLFLPAGNYCLRADLYNVSAVAMGLKIDGVITGANQLTSVCCNPNSSITGVVYNDLDMDGVQDSNEPGLENWQVNLIDEDGTIISSNSDEDGYYSFVDVVPGEYTLQEVLTGGWNPTEPTGGIYTDFTVGIAEVLQLDLGNVVAVPCFIDQGFELSVVSASEPGTSECCFTMDFNNLSEEQVYAIQIEVLDGIRFDADYAIAAGFFTPNYSDHSLTITSTEFGPLPVDVSELISFCLSNVTATPQFVEVSYFGEDFESVLCSETLTFQCGVQNMCLEYVEDQLECGTEGGYDYSVDFVVPSGSIVDGGIGFIKLHVDTLNAAASISPASFTFDPPLQAGDTVTLEAFVESDIDLLGEELCILITAHDDVEERLCCFAYEGCIPFPDCYPCEDVAASILPLEDDPSQYCCYQLNITDDFTLNPTLLTGVNTRILTPDVTFDGLSLLNALQNGWVPDFDPESPVDIAWTHETGQTPDVIDFPLFEFCLEGQTNTDSVAIEVNWLNDQQVLCSDTLRVYCPDCTTIVEDELTCYEGNEYVYTFSFVNGSPFDVNAVSLLNTEGTPDDLNNPGTYFLGATVPPGGTYTGYVAVDIGPIDEPEMCFDLVLRQIVGDEVNITCCYTTHCVELVSCEEFLGVFCVDPDLATDEECTDEVTEICSCNGEEYLNLCYASNAGVQFYATPPNCGVGTQPLATDHPIALEAQAGTTGSFLSWSVKGQDQNQNFDYFILRELHTNDASPRELVRVAANESNSYHFLAENAEAGLQNYEVIGVYTDGRIRRSNPATIYVPGLSEVTTVHMYPSPASTELKVNVNHTGLAVIDVFGSEGNLALQAKANFSGGVIAIPLETLENGVYVLRIRFEDGEVVYSRFVRMND